MENQNQVPMQNGDNEQPMMNQQPNMQQPMMNQQMMNGQPMMMPMNQGPGFMDQVKKVFSSGFKLFTKPEEAINETKDDSSIANVGILAAISALVLYISMLIFEKIFFLFYSVGDLRSDAIESGEGLSSLVAGWAELLGLDKIGKHLEMFSFGTEDYIKLFLATVLVVAVFFVLHAVMVFVTAKMDGKMADFKNILVSSNIVSIIFAVGVLLVAISAFINATIAIIALLLVIGLYGQATYLYLKMKFDVSAGKLMYMVPAMVIVNLALGLTIMSFIVDALLFD